MTFRKRVNFWGGLVFGTLVVVGGGLELYKAYFAGGPQANTATASPANQKMSRTEFKRAVEGKSKDDVIKALGRPSSTMNIGGMDAWVYDNMTTDEVTNAADQFAQVLFNGERVMSVNFI